MANNTGFYTLGSRSGSFVENKRDEAGALEYQGASNKIGIERQRALQDLSSSYEQTINNAYASYLAGQQAIANSNMGQGFKEQYLQMQRENTMSQIAQANQTSASVREEINAAANTAQEQVNALKAEETANLDRALTLMSEYRNYVNSLQDAKGKGMYDKEQQGWDIKYLYSDLFNMDPKDYYEDSSKTTRGKSYAEWVHEQMTGTDDDNAFSNWLYYNQGLQNLGQMIERSKLETPYEKKERELNEISASRKENENIIITAEDMKNVKTKYDRFKNGISGYHFTYNDEQYTISGDITTKLAKKISSSMNMKELISSGQYKVGDIFKYENKLYQIVGTKYNSGLNYRRVVKH